MLKNPAYAGAFVYGRTCQKLSNHPGARPVKSPRPGMDWRVVVKDKYPAYVSWETFEKIKAMLRDNRAKYLRIKSRGIPRDGAALLHGITWCAASAATRWSCATRAAANTFAITCISITAFRFANA
jgi:hypothetical protein